MVEVNGSYENGRYAKMLMKVCVYCPTLESLSRKTAGRTNTTHYIHTYDTHLNSSSSFSSSAFPAISLRFSIFGEIFAYVTVY